MTTHRHLTALALATAALAAGCGGASSGDDGQATGASGASGAAAPAASAPAVTPAAVDGVGQVAAGVQRPKAGAKGTVAAKDPVHTGRKVQKAKGEKGTETGTTGAKASGGGAGPCALVTRAEAGAIVGRAIHRLVTAPQGPTCIYQASGEAKPITVAIERLDLAAVRKQSKALGEVKVGRHSAYCVKYGSVMTFVPLSGGRLLNINAPCQMAAGFAAKALERVS